MQPVVSRRSGESYPASTELASFKSCQNRPTVIYFSALSRVRLVTAEGYGLVRCGILINYPEWLRVVASTANAAQLSWRVTVMARSWGTQDTVRNLLNFRVEASGWKHEVRPRCGQFTFPQLSRPARYGLLFECLLLKIRSASKSRHVLIWGNYSRVDVEQRCCIRSGELNHGALVRRSQRLADPENQPK
jgi:hypothetical protein